MDHPNLFGVLDSKLINIKVQRHTPATQHPYTLSVKAGLKFAKFLIDFKKSFDAEYTLENETFPDTNELTNFPQASLNPSQKDHLITAKIA